MFYSQTGQTRKFIQKLIGVEAFEITPENFDISLTEPFILVVPSYEANVHPIVIDTAADFLETADNISYCKGLFGGGNRNFAQLFGITAKMLSEEYQIPVLHEFEFQGSPMDVKKLEEELEKIGNDEKEINQKTSGRHVF